MLLLKHVALFRVKLDMFLFHKKVRKLTEHASFFENSTLGLNCGGHAGPEGAAALADVVLRYGVPQGLDVVAQAVNIGLRLWSRPPSPHAPRC